MSNPDPDRTEWLEARRKGIGGSDAPVAAGLSPWKTPHELYLEKRGEIEPPDLSSKEHIYWGNVLEDPITKAYTERTGRRVRRVNRILQHPDHPFMLANLDRDVVGEKRILEIKTTNAHAVAHGGWGEPGTDEVPEYYLLQVMHYMAVTGAELADLAVLIGGQEMRIYEIPRDETLIKELIEVEVEFWDGVQTGEPPSIDYQTPGALELLKRKYPGTNGQSIVLPPTAETLHLQLADARAQIRAAKAQESAAKAALLDMMGENAVGLLPGGIGSYRRALRPESEVSYTRQPFVDFRYSKKND